MYEENASYYYHLSVIGTEKDQKHVYSLLQTQGDEVLDYYLAPNGPDTAPYSSYFSPKRTEVWPEFNLDEVLHEVAVAVPNVKLQIQGANDFDGSYGFIKQFIGDSYQEVRQQMFMPELQDCRIVPFTERHTATFNTSPAIFSLYEEFEKDDGIREFQVLATASNKDDLRKLMLAKIQKDEYGYVADNGVDTHIADYFCTKFDEGFVSYSINAETILSPKEIDALLQTPAFSTTIFFPENLRSIVITMFDKLAKDEGYGVIDSGKAADAFMTDKRFHALIKTSWWGDYQVLSDRIQPVVFSCCYQFAASLLEDNPNWLEEIGAAEQFDYPDNMLNVLLDSIFDVARDYRLPVQSFNETAGRIMRSSNFKNLVKNTLKEITHLQEGVAGYQEAYSMCYSFVRDQIVPEKDAAKPSLNSMINQAETEKQQGRGEPLVFIPEKNMNYSL